MRSHLARPVVSVIVVSYNTRDMTLDCLRSLKAETPELDHEVIVVDNASTDGSAAAIAAEAPWVRLVSSEENVGFARANNLAGDLARGDYLLLLNPDTVVRDRAVERLTSFARCCPEAGVWGGRTQFPDGSLNPASCWARLSLWNLACRAAGLTGLAPNSAILNSEAYGGWDSREARRVDIVSGCFLLIKRSLWRELNGFSPRYFMYGEDADLCLRATTRGAAPMITPAATIVHYGGASETCTADKLVRLLKAKSSLVGDHLPRWQVPLARALLAAWPMSRMLATRLVDGPGQRVGDVSRAGVWAEVWARRSEWYAGYRIPPGVTPRADDCKTVPQFAGAA